MDIENARRTLILRDGWKFRRGKSRDGAAAGLDDRAWETVRVPHDWAIYGPFDRANDIHRTAIVEDGETGAREHTGRTGALPHVGQAWYRLPLVLPDDAAERRVRIEFDGVMSRGRVFWNGEPVGERPYGYISFAFDLSGRAQPGANLLAVSVDNPPEASRWYPGAGIYRNVRLVMMNPVHVAHWGVSVATPSVSAAAARVVVRTDIENHCGTASNVELETVVTAPDGKPAAAVRERRSAGKRERFEQTLEIERPELWSIETPRLYAARTRIIADGRTVDEVVTPFGIRTIRFSATDGFQLNDARVRINGVCMHHDLGPLGSAINRAALERQLRILKDMGCNAIRTAHNPPAPELLDMTDRMGFVVMDEAFDEWRMGKCPNGYHRLFDQWAETDLRDMIRRDRNHPSVVMWSIGNEIGEQNAADGAVLARRLCRICRQEDPTRPTTAGLNWPDGALKNGFAAELDVPGWNYKPERYGYFHHLHPEWPMFGSETAACISSRGVYHFPADEDAESRHPSLQASSYDLACTGFGTLPDVEFRGVDEHPWIAGEFVWTGFDYLGEPTPFKEEWPSRSSYFGIVDLSGIPKDRYHLYRSRWSNRPTLRLAPHWTWPGREGLTTPVFCYSSWNRAELFVNGVSQGIRCKRPTNLLGRYRHVWSGVRYEPGELRVVAFDNRGRAVCEAAVNTAGEAAAIDLSAERAALCADGDDLAFIYFRIRDTRGNLCPHAAHRVRFTIDGPAGIAAVCNGDPTSLESFQADNCPAFNGQGVLYLRGRAGAAGTVRVRAAAEGLAEGFLEIEALPPDKSQHD